jgi:hypothetical protein
MFLHSNRLGNEYHLVQLASQYMTRKPDSTRCLQYRRAEKSPSSGTKRPDKGRNKSNIPKPNKGSKRNYRICAAKDTGQETTMAGRAQLIVLGFHRKLVEHGDGLVDL